jgi:signal transduction histidine kinase
VEVAAYRIVQEALTNVLRHADARTCAVDLRTAGGTLVVTVADDGAGVAPCERAGGGGAGVPGMRERAEELGGTFTLDTTDGGGTVVRAVLPRDPS